MPAIRSDIKIGNLEKKLGLAKGTIRNPDGSDARDDKRLGTLRHDYERMYAGPPVRISASMKATAEALKKAAARQAKAAGLPQVAVRVALPAARPQAAPLKAKAKPKPKPTQTKTQATAKAAAPKARKARKK